MPVCSRTPVLELVLVRDLGLPLDLGELLGDIAIHVDLELLGLLHQQQVVDAVAQDVLLARLQSPPPAARPVTPCCLQVGFELLAASAPVRSRVMMSPFTLATICSTTVTSAPAAAQRKTQRDRSADEY